MPSFNESRTHWGAWIIVSAPLILGMSVSDTAKLDAMWPLLSNTEVSVACAPLTSTAAMAAASPLAVPLDPGDTYINTYIHTTYIHT